MGEQNTSYPSPHSLYFFSPQGSSLLSSGLSALDADQLL